MSIAGDGDLGRSRILFVTERLMRGGLQEVMVLIATELHRRGHDITCFVSKPVAEPNPYLEALEQAGIPVVQAFAGTELWARRLSLSRVVFGLASPLIVPLVLLDAVIRRRSPGRSLVGAYGAFRRILAVRVNADVEYFLRQLGPLGQLTWLVLRKRPQLVHVFFPEGVDRVRRWSSVLHLPMIFSDHTPYENEWSPPTPSLARALSRLDGLTVLDDATAQRVRLVYGVRSPVLVAPQPVPEPAVDTNVLASATTGAGGSRFRIGCLARFDRGKGLSYLLRAMIEIARDVPEAELWLAGGGTLEHELLAQCHELRLEDRVRMLGWVSGRDKLEFLTAVDVLVLPSLMEGIPIAILEAMLAGKPVVATRVGAVHTAVIDGVTGVLVEPRDATALARALIRMARDPALRARMGASGRQRVQSHFSLERAVDSIEQFYATVLEQAVPSSAQQVLKAGSTGRSTARD